MKRALTLALVLALGAMPSFAAADPARDQYARAVKLHDEGRFEEALLALSEARDLTRDPRLLALIHLQRGIEYAILGSVEPARAAFGEALRSDPAVRVDPEVVKPSIVAMFERERERLLQPVGRHPTGSVTRRSALPTSGPSQEAVAAPGTRRARVWTWVMLGAALACAGTGLGLWLYGRDGYDEYLTTGDPLRFDELERSVPRRYIAADVMLGVGAALAVTSVLLYFLEGRRPPEGRRLGVLPGLAGSGLRLRF